ncbi:MAG TPA: DUF4405 domain-containing protein [Herpetosiphonaceae bacterium]
MQPSSPKPKSDRNKLNLLLDISIFVAFLIAMAPHASGVALHEWLSIAFGAAIVVHLLLHWEWVIGIGARFLKAANARARLNFALNALLFIDIVLVIWSGLMISEVALPAAGFSASGGGWRQIHDLTANLSLLLTSVHVAFHWDWIVRMLRRLTPAGRRAQRAAQLAGKEA